MQRHPPENVRRIAIIGMSASGKTTTAHMIAKKTGLPVFHVDQLIYMGNWIERPEDEYNLLHKKLLAENDRWIIEGYVYRRMLDRLQLADMVIYLDNSGIRNTWQYIKRYFAYRKTSRPELPETVERFSWTIFKRVFDKGQEWRGIEETLKEVCDKDKVFRIKSPRELGRLASLFNSRP
jgi:adenylate kinase family enzyme